MGKIAPGGILPTRQVIDPFVPDQEKPPPPHYLEYILTRLTRNIDRILRLYADQSRLVEEYAGESSQSATGETVLTVVADYEPANERITSVLVTGPVNTPFVLELGSRYMTLSTDATGKCLLAPVAFTLTPQSKRVLTAETPVSLVVPNVPVGNNGTILAATAGSVSLPSPFDSLSGFSISLSTVGTAAMTVTVSNVVGGPYVYTIPVGAQQLTVNYPIALQATGIAPQVAWSATAAAVGNVGVFGVTSTIIPQSGAGSWFLQLSGYALGNVRSKN